MSDRQGATMNFRRGFFRLWAVMAVPWMLGFLFVAVRDGPWLLDESVIVEAVCGTKVSVPINVSDAGIERMAADVAARIGKDTRQSPRDLLRDDGCLERWQVAPIVDASGTHHTDVARIYSEAFKSARDERISYVRERARQATVLAILPPAILLALGAAVAWALSGFKRG